MLEVSVRSESVCMRSECECVSVRSSSVRSEGVTMVIMG